MNGTAGFDFQGAPRRLTELPPAALPARVGGASIEFARWLEVQRIDPAAARKLPQWVVCNRVDDARTEDGCGPGPDPFAAVPEWARPCLLCGTSCYVKGDFVVEGFRVVDWFCFRKRGGRDVRFHPVIWAEIEDAGLTMFAWEAIGEMRAWLAEPDARGAHVADELPPLWRRLMKTRIRLEVTT